jgi:hypothetical protein
MADDIVTRLRGQQNIKIGSVVYTFEPTTDTLDAANEIERLRAEVTRWKGLAADLAMQCAINEMEGGNA